MRAALACWVVFSWIVLDSIFVQCAPEDIEDSLHPINLVSQRDDEQEHVTISISYVSELQELSSYWVYRQNNKFSPITTNGDVVQYEEGGTKYTQSSITIAAPQSDHWGYVYSTAKLTFVVSTKIGEFVLDILEPDTLENQAIRIPKSEIKVTLSRFYAAAAISDSDWFIQNLTIPISYGPSQNTKTFARIRGIHDFVTGYALRDVVYFDEFVKSEPGSSFVEKVLSIPRHRMRQSEEFVFGIGSGNPAFYQDKIAMSVSQYHYAIIHPSLEMDQTGIVFINTTRPLEEYTGRSESDARFPATPDRILLEDHARYRTIACAAFGYPRPVVKIYDPEGRYLPSTNLRHDAGLTTHVVLNLDSEKPVSEIAGDYTCEAFIDMKGAIGPITRTISVVRVEKPKVVYFGFLKKVITAYQSEIIAECEVRGSPLPWAGFIPNGDMGSPIAQFFGSVGSTFKVAHNDSSDGLSRVFVLTMKNPNGGLESVSCVASESTVHVYVNDVSDPLYMLHQDRD